MLNLIYQKTCHFLSNSDKLLTCSDNNFQTERHFFFVMTC